jgi:hypothetical protein
VANYIVTMKDQSTQEVAGADAYQQEGQMTTFFRTEGLRDVVDSWSTRLFSVRTTEILMIRRVEGTGVLSERDRRATRSLATAAVLRTAG